MNRDRKDLDKLDSLIDGRRDGRNGWINARRARKDRAYAVGVALGEYEYQQFLAGPSNPALGYVPPEPPAEIYEPFLAILMARSKEPDALLSRRDFQPLTEEALASSPVAGGPFGRSFVLQLGQLTTTRPAPPIRRFALC